MKGRAIFKQLLRKAMGSGSGLILAAFAAFFVNVFLSRQLSPKEYGSIVLMLTWATIGAQFVQLGFLRASTKIVAAARSDDDAATIKAFVIFAFISVTIAAFLGGAVLATLIHTTTEPGSVLRGFSIATGALLWPLGISRVASGFLLGESRSFQGAFFQSGLPYTGMLFALSLLVGLGGSLVQSNVASILLVGATAAAVLGILMVAWSARDVIGVKRGSMRIGSWFALSLPLMVIGAIQVLNKQIGPAMIGAMSSPESVAAYYPVVRISEFAAIGLITVNVAIAPRLAAAYKQRDMKLLQRVLTSGAKLSLLSTVLIVAGTFLIETWLLGLFGGVSQNGSWALRILLAGQLINAATGSVGILMAMAGQERFAAIMAGAVLALNVLLHLLLVPKFGIEGSAATICLCAIIWNLSLFKRSRTMIGVNPTIFSRRG